MNQKMDDPKWWWYLARFFLGLTIAIMCACVYLIGAAKGFFGELEPFGAYGFGFYFAFSFAALLGLALLAMIGLVVGFLLKYSLKIYVIMLALSLVVIFYFEYTI